MKWIDPSIELVAAGSSNADMPTFGTWEKTVLEHGIDVFDHISLHAYYEENGDVPSFLASGVGLDRYIRTVADIIRETLEAYGSERTIGISVDEWNVWNQTRFNEVDKPPLFAGKWEQHPRIIEDEYTVTDAVVVGSLLMSLLRNSDVVSMANLAQLVNVIAPIRSEPNGPAWRQTTFHPFALTARFATGDVVSTRVYSDRQHTSSYGDVSLLDTIALTDGNELTLFLVNRSTTEPLEVVIDVEGPPIASVLYQRTLGVPATGNRHTSNTQADPDAVLPLDLGIVTVDDTGARAVLPPLSWSIVRLATLRPSLTASTKRKDNA
jgi:alpha-N-arabinofuranosidase